MLHRQQYQIILLVQWMSSISGSSRLRLYDYYEGDFRSAQEINARFGLLANVHTQEETEFAAIFH